MDHSFGITVKKLQEHYKIDVCTETIRKITMKHAERAKNYNKKNIATYKEQVMNMIAETDGSMVPIVEIDKESQDKRKNKKLFWKEFRLAAVQKKGDIDWLYGVSAESVDQLGNALERISLRCGFFEKTKVHAVGDGALWIYDQMDKIFGCQMNYTIDFFHLCDYLSNAAEGIINDKKTWMKNTKLSLKQGKIQEVLLELKNYQKQNKEHKGLKDCIRYFFVTFFIFFFLKHINFNLKIYA